MRLEFDGLIIGGGSQGYYLDPDLDSLSPKANNNTTPVPRTDFTRSISIYLSEKIWRFTGTLIGRDQYDFRYRKRELSNTIKKDFTFYLIDDFEDNSGNIIEFARYEFTGKVVAINPNINVSSNSCKFLLQIYSEDPRLYLLPEINRNLTFTAGGFTLPLHFPFHFSGSSSNSIVITNSGEQPVYPTIIVTGACDAFSIESNNEDLINNEFQYTEAIVSGDSVVITPLPTDPIKVRADGVSAIANTNSNFEPLIIYPGKTTLTLIVPTGSDENTGMRLTYKNAFAGI